MVKTSISMTFWVIRAFLFVYARANCTHNIIYSEILNGKKSLKHFGLSVRTFCQCDATAFNVQIVLKNKRFILWAPSSEFVSSSIPSGQILTAHAQPFRGARDLAFCPKVPLDSLLV